MRKIGLVGARNIEEDRVFRAGNIEEDRLDRVGNIEKDRRVRAPTTEFPNSHVPRV